MQTYLYWVHPKPGEGGKGRQQFRRPWRRGKETWHGKHVKFHAWSPSVALTARQSRMERSHAVNPTDRPTTAYDLSAFEMEFPEVKCAYYPQDLLFSSDLFPLSSPCPLPSSTYHLLPIPIPIAFISGMGRRPWATPEQLEYLKGFIPMLQRAKSTTGLTTLYTQVYDGFLPQWGLPSVVAKAGTSPSPEQLRTQAEDKLRKVSIVLNSSSSFAHSLPAHQKLVWGRTKEGKVLNPPTIRTSPSRPRLIRKVETQEASLSTPPGNVHSLLATNRIPAPPRG